MTPKESTQLSVIIPTYRRPQLLEACLTALCSQDVPAEQFEVIVVDDCSGPETVETLELASRTMSNLRWLSQPENRGPAAARNQAVALSSAPLLLFLDDDIVASPTLVRTHLELHQSAPAQLGIVGLVDWLPSLKVTRFMHWLDSTNFQFDFAHMSEGRQRDASHCFYTCNLSLDAELFRSVGGFDERFPFPAFEDTELCTRLMRKGFVLDYRPTALAWHSRAITLEEFCNRMRQVAMSALVFQQVRPDANAVNEGLATVRHSSAVRTLLRFITPVVPKLLGRDLRNSYYRDEIRCAYVDGLNQGRAKDD